MIAIAIVGLSLVVFLLLCVVCGRMNDTSQTPPGNGWMDREHIPDDLYLD